MQAQTQTQADAESRAVRPIPSRSIPGASHRILCRLRLCGCGAGLCALFRPEAALRSTEWQGGGGEVDGGVGLGCAIRLWGEGAGGGRMSG